MSTATLQAPMAAQVLCVDLDGTLVRTDTLLECLLDVLRQRPMVLLLLPWWLLRGRAWAKRRLAEACEFDAVSLPYRAEILADLRAAHAAGRTLALATAADGTVARAVAGHLGIFDRVFASDGVTNLKGEAKLSALKAAYGTTGFDYAGNSRADLPVFRGARRAWVVGGGVAAAVRAAGVEVERVYTDPSPARAFIRAIRPHQWVKNLLVFVPMLAGHKFTDLAAWVSADLTFCAFCMAASAAYLVNDLLDVRNDRRHERKKHRPFASGSLPLSAGLAAPALAALSLVFARLLTLRCLALLGLYFAATLVYSVVLRDRPIADVIVLACLYSVRLMAGGEATNTVVSVWLLSVSTFIFLSLALGKRTAELRMWQRLQLGGAAGRGYQVGDLPIIEAMGAASGYLSAMVMVMYLVSPDVVQLYRHPGYLWLMLPLLLSWVSHFWLMAHRGEMTDDPILFAVRDRTSLVLAAGVAVVASLAI